VSAIVFPSTRPDWESLLTRIHRTSDSSISIWSPLAASVFFGFGILCVFISSYQYIIDSYEIYAASALASVTLIRYVAAGGMTVVGVSRSLFSSSCQAQPADQDVPDTLLC